MTTTPDPITTAREAALELRQIACLLNDDQAQTGANFDRETAIIAALDYAEKLNAENERLTNKVQSQHDYMAPKYDAAMAEIEKLKAEADPDALVIAHMHGAQMATEKHRVEIEKLKAERDVWKGAAIGNQVNISMFDRDRLGREVREAWVKWAETQLNPKASWLVLYDDLSEPDKEADRQIGEHIAGYSSYLVSVNAAEITRLTSQLDLYKAALEGISEVDDDGFTSDGHERCAERAAMALSQAASQCIKDRQAKGEAS